MPRDESAHFQRTQELEQAHRERPFERRSFLAMWAATLLRTPRDAKTAPLPAVLPGQLGVTFVGHSTVLLRYAQTRVLTDPNLGTHLFGLRRAWRAGLPPDALRPVDLVIVSHAHHDHLVRKSLRAVAPGAVCVVPPRCADLVEDLGFEEVHEVPVGESFRLRDVEVTAVPSRHWGIRMIGDYQRRGYGGYVVRGPGPSAYFAGDTAYFSGFAEIGARLRPDLALLPIGAYSPPGFRRSHMSPLDALYAFEDLGARLLIPIHFGSYRLSYEPLEEPPAWLAQAARERGLRDRVLILGNGESHVMDLSRR